MVDGDVLFKPGYYWDLDACGWARSPAPAEASIPEQPQTGVEDKAEADVRSG